MQKLVLYEAYTNSDLIEGRGNDVHLGYFKVQSDAEKASSGRGVMGTNAHVRLAPILIYENFEEFAEVRAKDVREQALNKLSWEERKLLGLG